MPSRVWHESLAPLPATLSTTLSAPRLFHELHARASPSDLPRGGPPDPHRSRTCTVIRPALAGVVRRVRWWC